MTRRKKIIGIISGVSVVALGAALIITNIYSAGRVEANKTKLSKNTHIGVTQLNAKDPEKLVSYYVNAINLEEISKENDITILGKNNYPLISIKKYENSATSIVNRAEPGLYHSAILFENKTELANTLIQVLEKSSDSYAGAADHLVSEAFYFTDPEGNGLELYVDRSRDEWQWNNGKVKMDTLPLDVNKFISDNASGEKSKNAKMGHVHMKVGDAIAGKKFYSDILGFDIVSEIDGAVFYSAGGYHHHIGTNNWGINPRTEKNNELGLSYITVKLGDAKDLKNVIKNLEKEDYDYEKVSDNALKISDPWGNKINLEL